MAEKWKDRLTDQLCKAILVLETEEEVYRFLEDIATIGEIRALAQRLEVARLLSEGYTYPQIAQQTGASTATISRVKKFLEYGADGYKIVLDRLKETNRKTDLTDFKPHEPPGVLSGGRFISGGAGIEQGCFCGCRSPRRDTFRDSKGSVHIFRGRSGPYCN